MPSLSVRTNLLQHDELQESIKKRFIVLKAQRKTALETAADMLTEMKRLKLAYRALSGDEALEGGDSGPALPQSPTRNETARKPARKKEPTLDRESVRQALHEVLLFGALGDSVIRERVGEIARRRGATRLGLHWTIRNALKAYPEFEQHEDGWVLNNPQESGLIPRVRSVLEELGPLPEPKIQAKIEEESPNAADTLNKLLHRTLKAGPFEFRDAKWSVTASQSAE